LCSEEAVMLLFFDWGKLQPEPMQLHSRQLLVVFPVMWTVPLGAKAAPTF